MEYGYSISRLRQHGLQTGYLASLAPYSVTAMQDVRIVNLPGYLLERLGSSIT